MKRYSKDYFNLKLILMCAELTPTGGKPASNIELLIAVFFRSTCWMLELKLGWWKSEEYIWNHGTKHTFQPSIPDLETAASFNLDWTSQLNLIIFQAFHDILMKLCWLKRMCAINLSRFFSDNLKVKLCYNSKILMEMQTWPPFLQTISTSRRC